MITHAQMDRIRALDRQGLTRGQIARKTGHCLSTVDKYLSFEGYPAPREPRRSECPPSLEPYRALMEQWVNEDEGKRRKDRKTAKEITRRLREEHGFTGAASLVQAYVARLKKDLMFREMCKPDAPRVEDLGPDRRK